MADSGASPTVPAATIELTVDSQDLAWADFVEAGTSLTGILREVEASLTDVKQTGVRWVVQSLSKRSPARVVFAGQPIRETLDPATLEQVVTVTASGLQSLQRGVEWPSGFNEPALEQARKLADLVGERVSQIRVQNGSEPVTVTRQVAVNVDELIAPWLRSVGTIEGRLEGIHIHAKEAYAWIYDPLDDSAVRAYFARDLLAQVIAAFGSRVAVFGEITSRPTGERFSITASRIEALPARKTCRDRTRSAGSFEARRDGKDEAAGSLLGCRGVPRPVPGRTGTRRRLSRDHQGRAGRPIRIITSTLTLAEVGHVEGIQAASPG
jgi:hypothetical protein